MGCPLLCCRASIWFVWNEEVILTAHQPVYLPWLGLFDKIRQADTFVSFNQVQYEPRGFQNRNRILTRDGPIWLTVPVLKKGHRDKPMSDIRINNALPWQRKHWRSITQAYQKAPYWKEMSPILEWFYQQEWDTLVELNQQLLEVFLSILRIDTDILYASDYDFQGTNSNLVLDMCQRLGADTYIFGGEGEDYAGDFGDIRVEFQDYIHPVYPQLNSGFISHLSIVDLLMNCGAESLGILTGREA